ncbi:hypothetical protein [Ligilactobacillus cholophilus]|uniref:hypothetical protein n=1 Tax=Ligilactobacillus cholophilus TaxID=3050131 RepID=UPI0025B06ECC|nr:hypothetical protein [Ligilactobacillus cholophilus]
MIRQKDVITIRMPYPNIHSRLAKKAHMYICKKHDIESEYELIKCQSYKTKDLPYLNHRIIEDADIRRNPFNHRSLIDCDKLFLCQNINISDVFLTSKRRDVCSDLYDDIINELNEDGFDTISLPAEDMKCINDVL